MTSDTVHLSLDDLEGLGAINGVDVTLTDTGAGRPVLLLHGGGGPATVLPWADRLAASRPARVITPIHPGFDGTTRPDALTGVPHLASLYIALLEHLDLTGVTVVGNSIGGWITAEMATLAASSRVSGFVIVDGVGLEVPGHPVAVGLSPAELAQHAYYDPARFGIDPTALPPGRRAQMAANAQVLALYAGATMTDPTLADRLAAVSTPTAVIWGEADRIAGPEYGKALAHAIPGAQFEVLPKTGHLPQIETPDLLIDRVWTFITQRSRS
ncbi:alpha/beta hydrolase [Kineosporia sp. NBRC 101731]|nr:alpha/beta hydrolase [Kineosporia sp. NBRC 101731]